MIDNEFILPLSVDGGASANHTFRCVERIPGKSTYVNALFLEGSSALRMQIDISKKEPKATGSSLGTGRANVTFRIRGTITNATGQEVQVDLIKKHEISNPSGSTSLAFGNLKSLANAFEDSALSNRVFLSREY